MQKTPARAQGMRTEGQEGQFIKGGQAMKHSYRQAASTPGPRIRSALAAALMVACVTALTSASAGATPPGTGWQALSYAYPTHLPPGGTGKIQVFMMNTGASPSKGTITVTDTLPAGLTAVKAGGMPMFSFPSYEYGGSGTEIYSSLEEEEDFGGARWSCAGTTVVTCTSNPLFLPPLPVGVGLEAQLTERIGIEVQVAPDAAGTLANHVTVSGGGATLPTSVSDPVTVSPQEAGFGFSSWNMWFSNADGTPDTQAGSHPYEATFALGFNETENETESLLAGGEARNLEVELPPGFFGEPNVAPRCTRAQLDGQACPVQTQIGVVAVGAFEGPKGGPTVLTTLPVFNMTPPPGVPDEFAYSIAGLHAFFDAGVSSSKGYGLVEHIDNIPEAKIRENILTLWGVPADASHDSQRSNKFNSTTKQLECEEGCPSGDSPKPFLTLPTSCSGPLPFTIRAHSTWQSPSATAEMTEVTHDASGAPAGLTGCQRLSADPSISAVPDTSFADTPAGLSVDVKVPQEALRLPEGLVAATIKNTTVTLPEGVVINPGQAAGLVACQEAEANIHGEGPQSCPLASKVGTVQIRTPLLEGDSTANCRVTFMCCSPIRPICGCCFPPKATAST